MIIDDKLMKYVIFKRRTEKEVRQKCTCDMIPFQEMLENANQSIVPESRSASPGWKTRE